MMRTGLGKFAIATLLGICSQVWAGEVRIAVASNFNAPMRKIAAAFEQATGHTVYLTSAATGRLYGQIMRGTPYDVFLAADDDTPARLEIDGTGVAGSRFTYAIGVLVLWSPFPKLIDGKGDVLRTGKFAHLAIASPRLAPYGRAATDVLKALGLLETLAPKLEWTESVAEAYELTVTENADLGFVAMSQLVATDKAKSGSAWIVPTSLYRPIRQDAILLLNGRGNNAALAFLRFLKSDAGRILTLSFGYSR